MLNAAFPTLDLHEKNTYQAKIAIDAALKRAGSAYRIRVVHGYNRGTALRDMIEETYASHEKVLRLLRINAGTTDLILREI